MKNIIKFILILCLCIFSSSCTKSNQKNLNEEKNIEENSLDLTFEDVKEISGYIDVKGTQIIGLSEDGQISSFNGDFPAKNVNWEMEKRNIKKIKRIIVSSDSSYVLITEDNKMIFDHPYVDPEPSHKKTNNITNSNVEIEDAIFVSYSLFNSPIENTSNELAILTKDGKVWFTGLSSDNENYYLDDVNNISMVAKGPLDTLLLTKNDGSLEVWYPSKGNKKNYISYIDYASQLRELNMAVYAGQEIIGLKQDGTVVASGDMSQYVAEWRDIVYITGDDFVLYGLTSSGKVLMAGNEEILNELTTPYNSEEWKDIIAIKAGGFYGNVIALNNKGEILNNWLNEEKNGSDIGPSKYLTR